MCAGSCGCSWISPPVDRHLRPYHVVDLRAAVSDLAQDGDAVAAEERRWAVVRARPGRETVGKLHVDDPPFDRMLDLAEEADVGEMFVFGEAVERVHAAGRNVGLGQNLDPFVGRPGAKAR